MSVEGISTSLEPFFLKKRSYLVSFLFVFSKIQIFTTCEDTELTLCK